MNKKYTDNEIKDMYQFLIDVFKKLNELNDSTIILNMSNATNSLMVLSNLKSPLELAPQITEYISEIAHNIMNNGSIPNNNVNAALALVMGVTKHFQDMSDNELKSKYTQFKSGDLDGLTNDEIDKFIDMAKNESNVVISKVEVYYSVEDENIILKSDNKLVLFDIVIGLDVSDFDICGSDGFACLMTSEFTEEQLIEVVDLNNRDSQNKVILIKDEK